jgi:hypothetical protein
MYVCTREEVCGVVCGCSAKGAERRRVKRGIDFVEVGL